MPKKDKNIRIFLCVAVAGSILFYIPTGEEQLHLEWFYFFSEQKVNFQFKSQTMRELEPILQFYFSHSYNCKIFKKGLRCTVNK